MVAQQSYFTPAEIAWLRERYRADDVQTIVKKGGNFIVNTTKHVLPDFKTLFATARPAETDEEFEKRQAEAEIDERPSLVRREAETETEAKARLDEAYTVSAAVQLSRIALTRRSKFISTSREDTTRRNASIQRTLCHLCLS